MWHFSGCRPPVNPPILKRRLPRPCRKMATQTKSKPSHRLLKGYEPENFFDEMTDADGSVRRHYRQFQQLFQSLSPKEFDLKRQSVDLAFLRQGVTFNVYGDSAGT